MTDPQEIAKFVESQKSLHLYHKIRQALTNVLDKLSDEEFRVWLDYHLKTCERRDLQGYGSHMLHVCKTI